jgi:hypothetical protein
MNMMRPVHTTKFNPLRKLQAFLGGFKFLYSVLTFCKVKKEIKIS